MLLHCIYCYCIDFQSVGIDKITSDVERSIKNKPVIVSTQLDGS